MVEGRITEGGDECVETPTTLTPRDDGSLEYRFRGPSGHVGECILSRQYVPEDPEDIDTEGRKPSEIMRDLDITELPNTGGPALSLPVGVMFLASGILGVVAMRRRT